MNQSVENYLNSWERVVSELDDRTFFEALRPTSIGWKVEDLAEFDRRFAELRDRCDQVHLGWVNDRWLATLHLKEAVLPGGLRIIKLMQRRPGSTDATGLDHLDFQIPAGADAKAVLEKEKLEWTEEKNGDHCKWLSVWFAGTEAKLRSDTVLQVCSDEILECQDQLLRGTA